MQIPSSVGLTLEQLAKGSRWDVKTLNTGDGASDLLKATVEMSSAIWILPLFIKSREYPTVFLPGTLGTGGDCRNREVGSAVGSLCEDCPLNSRCRAERSGFCWMLQKYGAGTASKASCSGKGTGRANSGTEWEDSALLVAWQCYQTVPLLLIKILLQKHGASILFNMSTPIWQWRRPDRPDMTDNLAAKAATKNKGLDLLKGYRERVCSPADPMCMSHILNVWVWVQVKFANLYRSVSLPVIICYWVQVILLLIYSLGCSKQYLLHQIAEPAFRKCWYRWHKPWTLGDLINTIYKVAEFGEILEKSRKDDVITDFQKWSVIFWASEEKQLHIFG